MEMITVRYQPGEVFAAGFPQALVNEINSIRRNPRSYIPYIYLNRYSDYPLSERQETERFLRMQPTCNTVLRINPLLSEMAQRWTDIQGHIGDIGHGNLQQRLQQANIPLIDRSYSFAENIAYGFVDPRDIVMGWLVDYNVPGKGHRVNLFDCKYDQIGIGYGPHNNPTNRSLSYRTMVVNEYGTGFSSVRVGRYRRSTIH